MSTTLRYIAGFLSTTLFVLWAGDNPRLAEAHTITRHIIGILGILTGLGLVILWIAVPEDRQKMWIRLPASVPEWFYDIIGILGLVIGVVGLWNWFWTLIASILSQFVTDDPVKAALAFSAMGAFMWYIWLVAGSEPVPSAQESIDHERGRR